MASQSTELKTIIIIKRIHFKIALWLQLKLLLSEVSGYRILNCTATENTEAPWLCSLHTAPWSSEIAGFSWETPLLRAQSTMLRQLPWAQCKMEDSLSQQGFLPWAWPYLRREHDSHTSYLEISHSPWQKLQAQLPGMPFQANEVFPVP